MGTRSRQSIVNIILSFGAKSISILISLLVVPMTIHYVNPTRYGIWLTLSSIIAWIGFFDLGLGNGMRNKFAEAKAKNDVILARQYISTTYFTIGAIVLALFVIIIVVNQFVNWSSVLNVDGSYSEELRKVFGILVTFFCLNMVAKLFSTLMIADQRPGVASLISVCGQILSLIAIFVLTKVSEGSLINLAMFYAGIPTISLICWTLFAYHFSRYRLYAPRFSCFRFELIKSILNIGVQFFVIYLCMIAIFQIINIAISRELGPLAVTQYNIAYKYFSIEHSIAMIIISPFWSAFTDAYHKNDYQWMVHVKSTLEKLWLCAVVVVAGMVLFSNTFYYYWIGNKVHIDMILSICMAVYILVQTLGGLYLNLINGIGAIRLQLIVYITFAVISYPMMIYSCRCFGLIGVLLIPSLCCIVQALVAKIQIEKLLSNNSTGIWEK